MSELKETIFRWFKTNYSDLYELMRQCTHTHSDGSKNPYHLEGDLICHTKMVLDLAAEDINHIFAAVLHDIGKVYTRKEKQNGRVGFFDHENVSFVKSIDILNHARTEFNVDVYMVLQLVAWHGTLWNKIPIAERLKTLDACYGHRPEFLKELIRFVEADAYGRDFADEVQSDLDFVESQFEHLDRYIPYNKQQFREHRDLDAIFLVGISGSGKSTFIEKNLTDKDYEIVSVDKFFERKKQNYDSVDYKKNIKKAHNQSIKDLEEAVKNRKNIIVDMTNLTKEHRWNKLKRIPITQYNHKAVVFLTGEKQIKENLKNRDGKHLNYDIIERQITQFELPNYDEFDVITMVDTFARNKIRGTYV